MMFLQYSPFRSVSKTAVFLPILTLLMLTFCSKEQEYTIQHTQTTYSDVELHLDNKRNKKLGKPLGTYYTSSGEPYTGTQKIYHGANDSLYSKMYFEDGINTKSIFYMKNGDINKLIHGRYLNKPIQKKIYSNGVLLYQNVPPTQSEDGMGHLRTWHKNGQLSSEGSYTGDKVYQGLMTEYDKEGNIITQERYEDGEMVEKIK